MKVTPKLVGVLYFHALLNTIFKLSPLSLCHFLPKCLFRLCLNGKILQAEENKMYYFETVLLWLLKLLAVNSVKTVIVLSPVLWLGCNDAETAQYLYFSLSTVPVEHEAEIKQLTENIRELEQLLRQDYRRKQVGSCSVFLWKAAMGSSLLLISFLSLQLSG